MYYGKKRKKVRIYFLDFQLDIWYINFSNSLEIPYILTKSAENQDFSCGSKRPTCILYSNFHT